MKVTLAYSYKKHAPDDTVDLPDDVARRLLSDGMARLPAKPARKRAAVSRDLAEELTTANNEPTPTIRPRHNSGTGRTKEK